MFIAINIFKQSQRKYEFFSGQKNSTNMADLFGQKVVVYRYSSCKYVIALVYINSLSISL